jgi:predicted metal-dependent hydrolase
MPRAKPKRKTLIRELALEGLDAPVEVRYHGAARRLTLRVSPTRRAVIVTVPSRCRLDEAGVFVSRHIDWVRARLGDMPVAIPFADGVIVPVRGKRHLVRFTGPTRMGSVVRVDDRGEMPLLLIKGQLQHAPRRLKDWLVEQARLDLEERVQHHAEVLGLKAKRISLRDQASRWGSCSSTGLLSFSWRLVLAPRRILDYVAAHEVAHLAEMNHGPRFWALVEETYPEMLEAKAWLHQHGLELHRYGVVDKG